jgi:hypothetical protein
MADERVQKSSTRLDAINSILFLVQLEHSREALTGQQISTSEQRYTGKLGLHSAELSTGLHLHAGIRRAEVVVSL